MNSFIFSCLELLKLAVFDFQRLFFFVCRGDQVYTAVFVCVASVSVWVAMQKKICAEGFALQDYIMMWFTFYLFKCIPSMQLHALCIPWLSRNTHEWMLAAQVWIRLQY